MSRFINLILAASASSIAVMGMQAVPAHAAPTTPTTAPRSLLVGELGIEGGAAPGGFHPTAGTVEVEFDSVPLALERKVGRSGQFKFRLSPGEYTVIGCGPSSSGTPSTQCSAPQTLTLAAGEVDYIELVWAYVP
jgi:hypothetical protein